MDFRVVHGSHTNIKDRFKRKVRKLLESAFLHDKVSFEEFQETKKLSDDEFLDKTTGFFESEETQWILLLIDQELVSVATFVVMSKDIFLFNVCTHPSYRHRGYAKYLLFEIQKFAIEKHGITVIKGNADIKNSIAIDFYQKLGAKIDTNFSAAGGGGEKNVKSLRLYYEWDKKSNSSLPVEISNKQLAIVQKQEQDIGERLYIHFGLTLVFALAIGLVTYRNLRKNNQFG
ncbi:Acetyltransferase [Reticulomyxa filosa]|uniref:Acetyltransferase n=1 Tax=Reticulomyxa filosa TaxID=46433 RepID=X6NBI8_RETFI|nr:Acetyltransferase [Reticulomyxa filosa]|eukprot:ETO23139.1 Acetyltransferase [Reticulomyxa filosa]